MIRVLCLVLLALSESEAIVGGKEVKENEFPFMVAIKPDSPFSRDLTAGVLIRDNAVLTFAIRIRKGIRKFELSTWVVLAGTNSMHQRKKVKNRQRRRIHKFIDDRNTSGMKHPVGILWLNKPFQIGLHVNPIPMNVDTHPENGTECLTMGWGSNEKNSKLYWNGPFAQEFMLKGTLTINPKNVKCGKIDGDTRICCGSKDFQMCEFDAGDPCVQNKKVVAILVEIPSSCDNSKFGAVYFKIAAIKQFITSALDQIKSNPSKEPVKKIIHDEM